jgi:hypothetical protein
MIIHHDEYDKDQNQESKIDEEDINETGTMIIKKKEIEFTKSNNWHI